MRFPVSIRLVVAACALFGSGCYMHLDAVDSGIAGRLDALEQRVAALEQGAPPPVPPSVSSTSGRISKAEFTDDTPNPRGGKATSSKPAGRIRLKDPSALRARETGTASITDDE